MFSLTIKVSWLRYSSQIKDVIIYIPFDILLLPSMTILLQQIANFLIITMISHVKGYVTGTISKHQVNFIVYGRLLSSKKIL